MYSATWPKQVRSLASDFLQDPFSVTVGQEKLCANADVTQSVIIVQNDQEKLDELRKILETCVHGDLVLIFCETKSGCAWLGEHLYTQYRIPCTALHGDLEQSARDRAIQSFKTGRKPIMVGTDVAARGLDIKGIKAVINFDPASDGEDYVHRIGRTGRVGVKGFAYTLLTPKQTKAAKDIVKVMQAGEIPVPPELASMAGVNRGGGGKGRKGKGKGFGRKGGGKGGFNRGFGRKGK
jgi:ATP-dependent RNA helicase DDX5/DBP2